MTVKVIMRVICVIYIVIIALQMLVIHDLYTLYQCNSRIVMLLQNDLIGMTYLLRQLHLPFDTAVEVLERHSEVFSLVEIEIHPKKDTVKKRVIELLNVSIVYYDDDIQDVIIDSSIYFLAIDCYDNAIILNTERLLLNSHTKLRIRNQF